MCVTQAAMAGLQLGTQYGQQQTQYSMNQRRGDAITESAMDSLEFGNQQTLRKAKEFMDADSQKTIDRLKTRWQLESKANNQSVEQGVFSLAAVEGEIERKFGEYDVRNKNTKESFIQSLRDEIHAGGMTAKARISGIPTVAEPNIWLTTMAVASNFATEENIDKVNTRAEKLWSTWFSKKENA